jgi:hypothetical protein
MGRPTGPAACTIAPPAGLLPQQDRWASAGPARHTGRSVQRPRSLARRPVRLDRPWSIDRQAPCMACVVRAGQGRHEGFTLRPDASIQIVQLRLELDCIARFSI